MVGYQKRYSSEKWYSAMRREQSKRQYYDEQKRTEDKGEWWVYENWMVNKAKVHTGNCSHCNHGKGQNKDKIEGQHGKWHGSYLTRDEAWAAAQRLGRKDTGFCAVCCK